MEWEREIAMSAREGEAKARREAARNFFVNGVSIELIAKSLKMTQDEVREITKDVESVEA